MAFMKSYGSDLRAVVTLVTAVVLDTGTLIIVPPTASPRGPP